MTFDVSEIGIRGLFAHHENVVVSYCLGLVYFERYKMLPVVLLLDSHHTSIHTHPVYISTSFLSLLRSLQSNHIIAQEPSLTMQFTTVVVTSLLAILSQASPIDQSAVPNAVPRGLEKRDVTCVPKDGNYGHVAELQGCVDDMRFNREYIV